MTDLSPAPPAGDATDERSDAELISATRTGDSAAFGMLYLRHVDAANRLARTLASDRAAADDLVAEAFAKVLTVLRGGHGPDTAFRAYLLTSLRNAFYDQTRRDKRLKVTDDLTPYESGEEFQDKPGIELERSLVVRAFGKLPERWQTVLWHTTVEKEPPADVAPLLGLTANGVSALSYRARERLRELYLQEHLAETTEPECRWTTEHLGTAVRGKLSRRDRQKIDSHLDGCTQCTACYLELAEVNSRLPIVLAPAIVGATWKAYLGAGSAAKAGVLGAILAWFQHTWSALLLWCKHTWAAIALWFKGLITKIGPRNAALGGGAVAAVAAVLVALLLLSGSPQQQKNNAAGGPQQTQAPANPPAHKPPNKHPSQHPPSQQPPSQQPSQQPPAGKTPSHGATPPGPGSPDTPYKITPPTLTVGTLTAGNSNGSLPITISNPAGSGGTGGGRGYGTIPFPSSSASSDASATSVSSAKPVPPGGIAMTVDLPSSMTYRTGSTGGGWSCGTAGAGDVRCTHAALQPGTTAVATLHVKVGDVAGFQPVGVSLADNGATARSSFDVVVAPAGTSTGYAASGGYQVATAGSWFHSSGGCSTVARCPYGLLHGKPQGICRPSDWASGCVGSDSSAARLSLPAGASVRYAALVWTSGTDVDFGNANTVTVTGPGGVRRTLTGSSQGTGQWRADVTGLVGSGGAGNWSVSSSSPSLGIHPLNRSAGGWGLVVVASVPGAPSRNVAVFDGRASSDPVTLAMADTSGRADLGVLAYRGGTAQLGGTSAYLSEPATTLSATIAAGSRATLSGTGEGTGAIAIDAPA